ncbi:hypothetical protein MCEMSE15_02204 [Fimbriimonadaceae bacterium]
MESTPSNHLKIGAWLNAIIVKPLGGRRFEVHSNQAPKGWTVELHARQPEGIMNGEQILGWVVKISPLHMQVLLHEGDFGRLPVSDAMKPRYREGLRALLGQIEPTADNLADARGMVVRIQKQQQADWLTVWQLLDEPSTGEVKQLLKLIDEQRTARKEDPASMPELVAKLKEEFGFALDTAIQRLA